MNAGLRSPSAPAIFFGAKTLLALSLPSVLFSALSTSGSNYGPMNPDYAARVKTDADGLRAESKAAIPVDAVTASGSGLDPDISPANAERQMQRIADARGVAPARVREIILSATTGPALGFIGQPRVNVLKANLALDARLPSAHPPAR